MDENSSYNEYKVLLWSDPHKNRPYRKQRNSGGSSTLFGNRKADGFHRLIDSGAVDAVFHVGDTYSVYQEDYDDDGLLKPQSVPSGDEKPDFIHPHRADPHADLYNMVTRNRKVHHHFMPGNHDGGKLENPHHPFMQFVKRLDELEENFHAADRMVMGILYALHSHQYIDYVHYDIEGTTVKRSYYSIGRGNKKINVDVDDSEGIAKALCEQKDVVSFIEEHSIHADKNHKAKVYIVFGHTHKPFDVTIPVGENVEAHVINLGAMVPGKTPNYKIVHFKNGQVDCIKTVNFKDVSIASGIR
jgi:hypothetical protein